MLNNMADRLNNINWDFDNRMKCSKEMVFPINCRKYFSYPATFIPEIPFTLIEILSKQGDIVLDPFGGIGTTFLQAIIQRRRAISIDNNLIASSINKDFYNLLNPNIDLVKIMHAIMDICSEYNEAKWYEISKESIRNELSGWYHHKTFNEIAFLVEKYDQLKKIDEKTTKSLFHICLLNILTTVSSQNGGWAYIADNVKPKERMIVYKSAIDRLIFCAKQIVKDFSDCKSMLGEKYCDFYNGLISDQCIVNDDFVTSKGIRKDSEIDLIITSPPYPKMIDYVKSQRLSFYVEEREFAESLDREIGARYRRNKKDSLDEYVSTMKKCNKKIYSLLKPNGYLCYILPGFSESEDEKRKQAIEIVVGDCVEMGMNEVYRTQRCIPGTQRTNNIKWASLKNEIILVMEKKE